MKRFREETDMLRLGYILLLGILLIGCGASPAAPPRTAPPPASPTPSPANEQVELTPDSVLIDLRGYIQACQDPTRISAYDPVNGWREIEEPPRRKGATHYIDGKLIRSLTCDVLSCVSLAVANQPLRISRTASEYIGNRRVTLVDTAQSIPEYRSVELSGTIKIDVGYFLDEGCTQPQTYTTTLDLPN
jgi:hypothetical protein